MKILTLSNGKGEDALAVTLLKAVEEACDEKPTIKTLPLVGSGEAYTKAGYETFGDKRDLPSHGFSGLNPLTILNDIKAGLLNITSSNIKSVKRLSEGADVIICVGDIYPVALAAFLSKKPIIHLATAISASFRKYNVFEIGLFKKKCRIVFSRDEETAQFLRSKGVNARFHGNIMMDDPNLQQGDLKIKIDDGKKVIGLLPSARKDAYENTVKMLGIISDMKTDNKVEFLLSFSSNLNIDKLITVINKAGFSFEKKQESGDEAGRIAAKNKSVRIITGGFSGVVKASTLILGMTGTGNEQAVGLGTPLVLLKQGSSSTKERIAQYKKLLGEAVLAPEGSNTEIADEIMKLINDQSRLKIMSEAGKELIGAPGAAKLMAKDIIEAVK
jgi:uncharacterized protein (TIGR03492 family)